jgi:hydroxymethylpyrimidine/phosphomethylpyrimidine kinase
MSSSRSDGPGGGAGNPRAARSFPIHRSDHPILCTIAGSDPTGGAGLDADLRAFEAHGLLGVAVRSARTAQDETGVHHVVPADPRALEAELTAVLADRRPAALKTGMLATGAVVRAVGRALDGAAPRPLVVDPVVWAGAGGRLLDEDGVGALHEALAPHATLLTPNLPEAAHLLGRPEEPRPEPRALAAALLERGWRAVLVKGGHAPGAGPVTDWLAEPAGLRGFARPRVPAGTVRGTGCTLSAALAARLARGEALAEAVAAAGAWLHALLQEAARRGRHHLDPGAVAPPPAPGSLPPPVAWE